MCWDIARLTLDSAALFASADFASGCPEMAHPALILMGRGERITKKGGPSSGPPDYREIKLSEFDELESVSLAIDSSLGEVNTLNEVANGDFVGSNTAESATVEIEDVDLSVVGSYADSVVSERNHAFSIGNNTDYT